MTTEDKTGLHCQNRSLIFISFLTISNCVIETANSANKLATDAPMSKYLGIKIMLNTMFVITPTIMEKIYSRIFFKGNMYCIPIKLLMPITIINGLKIFMQVEILK